MSNLGVHLSARMAGLRAMMFLWESGRGNSSDFHDASSQQCVMLRHAAFALLTVVFTPAGPVQGGALRGGLHQGQPRHQVVLGAGERPRLLPDWTVYLTSRQKKFRTAIASGRRHLRCTSVSSRVHIVLFQLGTSPKKFRLHCAFDSGHLD